MIVVKIKKLSWDVNFGVVKWQRQIHMQTDEAYENKKQDKK